MEEEQKRNKERNKMAQNIKQMTEIERVKIYTESNKIELEDKESEN